MMDCEPDYLPGNVAAWQSKAAEYVAAAERAWASELPYWGIWGISDAGLELLPQDLSGKRCIELGCGTAYVSSWMCRRGGDVVAIDPTPNQLSTARRLQQAHGLDFVIEQGFAEQVGYPDESFDFAISEYGAALWADPYRWVPEASRLLKPGGMLVFLTNSPLAVMCSPDYEADGPMGERLLRPYFGMHITRWPDAPEETEFHLTHGEWISLLTGNDFVIERLLELQAPEGAQTVYTWADAAWAGQWPAEEAWVVSKRKG